MIHNQPAKILCGCKLGEINMELLEQAECEGVGRKIIFQLMKNNEVLVVLGMGQELYRDDNEQEMKSYWKDLILDHDGKITYKREWF